MVLSFYIGMVVGVVVGLILAGLLHMASDSGPPPPPGNHIRSPGSRRRGLKRQV